MNFCVRMCIKLVASLAIAAALASCEKREAKVVVFDGWWAADYAKGTCEQANQWWKDNWSAVNELGCNAISSCSEMKPIYEACVTDPVEQVRSFETRLRSEFGSAAACRGIEFIVLISPDKASNTVAQAMRKPYWSLIVDYVPGKQKQSWWLKRSDSNAAAEGDDSARDIVRRVCAIINERGAKF
jgi:hypothetical protein